MVPAAARWRVAGTGAGGCRDLEGIRAAIESNARNFATLKRSRGNGLRPPHRQVASDHRLEHRNVVREELVQLAPLPERQFTNLRRHSRGVLLVAEAHLVETSGYKTRRCTDVTQRSLRGIWKFATLAEVDGQEATSAEIMVSPGQ